jgi:hypothetical protein
MALDVAFESKIENENILQHLHLFNLKWEVER